MDLNELYIMLLEEYKMNTWTGLNIQMRYFVEKELITREEYELLTTHFKEHRPKKEQWFQNKEERIEFLEKMIELTNSY